MDDPKSKDLVDEAGTMLASSLDSVAKLLGPKMILMAGYLGTNDIYFDAIKVTLKYEFDHDLQSSFDLVKGTISSVEAATLLVLHAFYYSDRLDYDRFARAGERAGST